MDHLDNPSTRRSTRRALLALLGALLLASVGCTTGAEPRREQSERPPNVLVIMTDDQPVEDSFSVMPRTLEAFADEGTTFTNAYATTPLCCPSRASIFTGRYAHNHKVLKSVPGFAQKLDQDTTLQRYLSEAGYRNAIFGKYLNGWNLKHDPPHFDEWAIFEGGKPLGYLDGDWNVNGTRRTIHRYSTSYIQGRALDFLEESERKDDRPWLMFANVYAPHLPFTVPEKHQDLQVPAWEPDPALTEADLSDKPPFARRMPNARELGPRLREQQLRTLVLVDRMVAKLMTTLERLGEDRETIAIYTSDNGYMWGQHGLIKKSTPYRPSANVPLMIRWPGRVDGAVEDDRIVANIDIAPTIYEAAGITPDENLPVDGVSLLGDARRKDILLEYWQELPEKVYVSWASVLTEEAQYVEYYEKDLKTVRFTEYYDLPRDPSQLENLLGDADPGNDPDTSAFQSRLEELRACSGTSCR